VLHVVTWCYMTKICFDFKDMKWNGITVNDVIRWEKMFPDVNVVKAIRVDMPVWLEKNKNNRKAHKRNWTKFILNWLRRNQEANIGRL